MDILGYGIGAALLAVGMVGAVLPAVPGIPFLFAGVWLIAATDHFQHLTMGWLIAIAVVGLGGLGLDLAAAALGAKRIGASQRAVWGALLGTVVGVFFGLPGLLLGPFVGALLGELSAWNSVLRAAHVGVNTWIGLIIGTLAKVISSFSMLALGVAAWWWNRRA